MRDIFILYMIYMWFLFFKFFAFAFFLNLNADSDNILPSGNWKYHYGFMLYHYGFIIMELCSLEKFLWSSENNHIIYVIIYVSFQVAKFIIRTEF